MSLLDRARERVKLLAGGAEKSLYLAGVRSLSSLTLPDFVGIGFMKSGTTWLYENLRAHPEVYVSEHKELRYFDRNFAQSLASYAANFRAAPPGRLRGEVSPSYAVIAEQRIRFMRRVMPELRTILLMRDPVEREWSRVVHQVRRSDRGIDEVSDDEIVQRIDDSNVLRIGGYAAVIDRWRAVWGDQLFVGVYEDVKERPKELLTAVFEHVGAGTDIDWARLPYAQVIVPPTLAPHMPDHERDLDPGRGVTVENRKSTSNLMPQRFRDYLTERYARDLEELERRYGDRLAAWRSLDARPAEPAGD